VTATLKPSSGLRCMGDWFYHDVAWTILARAARGAAIDFADRRNSPGTAVLCSELKLQQIGGRTRIRIDTGEVVATKLGAKAQGPAPRTSTNYRTIPRYLPR
jgi:hypothetical protein